MTFLKPSSLILSTLVLTLGINLTACNKHEGGEGKTTEEIAAEQAELARSKTPAPTAKEPASPSSTFAPTATASASQASSSTATTAQANTATATASSAEVTKVADNSAGEKLYTSTCKTCHETGLAGAPKFGDKTAWKDRIAQGKDVLYKHSIEGYTGKNGVMPPKGGSQATDDEMKAAVDYMVAKAS